MENSVSASTGSQVTLPAPAVVQTKKSAPAPAAPAPAQSKEKSAAQRERERATDLAHLTQVLRESGNIPELNLPTRALRLNFDSYTNEVQIAVLDTADDSVVRLIPPRSLSDLARPDILPRGLLLRLMEQ